MNNYDIGDTNEWGYILREHWGPVELWETPKHYYVVYLMVTSEHILYAFRKYHTDALDIFESICNKIRKGDWNMVNRLGWSQDKLSSSYQQLIKVSDRFREISTRINQRNWISFNLMRDEGAGLNEVASEIRIPMAIAESVENARRCVIKWDSDWEKVRDCIAGKIDP